MLYDICLYLKNWFDNGQRKIFGEITIEDGLFEEMSEIQDGQYYRIVGSVFNDGVYKRGEENLTDEVFKGAIWLMAVPQDIIKLEAEIKAWEAKYMTADSAAMSPFQSESFGGYSYSKASGGTNETTGSSVPTWQGVFGARLRRYKKI